MSFHLYRHLADPDFLRKDPPPNYVAGLGRGAIGFTTRADIGPAREGLAKKIPESGKDADEDGDDARVNGDLDNERGLFATMPYEADDEEADKIYATVDSKMEERRKYQRETQQMLDLEKFREERPQVSEQFKDLKRDMQTVSVDEWANIPDPGDLVRKNKRTRIEQANERFFAVPDSLLSGTSYTERASSGKEAAPQTTQEYIFKGFSGSGAREKILGIKLDQASDSVTGQTNIDPTGYLTGLGSLAVKSDSEISDIKRARTLLKSLIKTNPRQGHGWIAAARLEEVAGNISTARKLMHKACDACPSNEDVWLEAARLEKHEKVASLLAKALAALPNAIALWIKAIDVEQTVPDKRRIAGRALQVNRTSLKLWKTAIELEDDKEQVIPLMTDALVHIPHAVELWLALARLHPYEDAKTVLNKARSAVPSSFEIWVEALKLEERHSSNHSTNDLQEKLNAIMAKSMSVLSELSLAPTNEAWLKEAQNCERQGLVYSCKAIVESVFRDSKISVDAMLDYAQSADRQKNAETARNIYLVACERFAELEYVWEEAAFFEKDNGSFEQIDSLLQKAVRQHPQNQVFWLLGAKERYIRGDIKGAKAVLDEAFKANANSEEIWLAALKLELETGALDSARMLLTNARTKSGTERIWIKSIFVERLYGPDSQSVAFLESAFKQFPRSAKLYLSGAFLYWEDLQNPSKGRELLGNGMSLIKTEASLPLLAARIELEALNAPMKARLTLEKARKTFPTLPKVWLASIYLELQLKESRMAQMLLGKALQACPSSGELWDIAIYMEPAVKQRAKCADALDACPGNASVVCSVAESFWRDSKLEKARLWFLKAVELEPKNGDIWARFYLFEQSCGGNEVLTRCEKAEPKVGYFWPIVSKSIKHYKSSTSLKIGGVCELFSRIRPPP